MRLIGAWSHAIVDYALAVLMLIGPSISGFTGRQAVMSYILGITLFVLAFLTRYPLGVIRLIRFPIHGALELPIAILFLILPWLANFARGVHSRNFFVLMALILLAVWFMTDFRGLRGPSSGLRPPFDRLRAGSSPRKRGEGPD